MNILTLTGPSCSGKTTLLQELVNNHGFCNVISHTTRPMRPGEVDGKDYHFISPETFEHMNHDGEFVENVNFNGYWYGKSLDEIRKAEASDKTAVMILEPNGLIEVIKYAGKRDDIKLKTVYIDGDAQTLLSRYIKRMAGEDLTRDEVVNRHVKRIDSMVWELKHWRPTWLHALRTLCQGEYTPGTIPYDIVLSELGPENTDEVIKQIKEMEFK